MCKLMAILTSTGKYFLGELVTFENGCILLRYFRTFENSAK